MGTTDWGRIIARVLATTYFIGAVLALISAWPTLTTEYAGEGVKLSLGLGIATPVLVGLLLWLFSHRFAPQSPGANIESDDRRVVGSALIAAVGAFVFFDNAQSAITFALSLRDEPDGTVRNPGAHFVAHSVLVFIAAALVVWSRRVVEFISK